MKFKQKYAKMVTCPRCGMKTIEGVECCPDCGLIFSRLELATNKDAKRKIKRGDRDYIIKTNKLPSDVNYWALLLICLFLGPMGGHCYYVGKYWRGGILTTTFFALIMFVIFNAPLMAINDGALLGILATICGLIELMWVWDFVTILIKKFKVPVAIDLESEKNQERESKRKEFFKDTVLDDDSQIKDKVNNDIKEE